MCEGKSYHNLETIANVSLVCPMCKGPLHSKVQDNLVVRTKCMNATCKIFNKEYTAFFPRVKLIAI